jgi:integrase/recombinase XerD
MSPLRRRMIGDMAVRNLPPPTRPRGLEVQPLLWPLAGTAGSGGDARLSGPPRRDRDLVAGDEPDRLRAAVLLGRHARAWRDPGAHSLRTRTPQVAGDAERGEAVRFLEAVPSLKTRAALTTTHAARLRASEAPGSRWAMSTAVGW